MSCGLFRPRERPRQPGVFKPEHANAVVLDTMPEGVLAKGFAVTLENEAGSDKPTSPILISGEEYAVIRDPASPAGTECLSPALQRWVGK